MDLGKEQKNHHSILGGTMTATKQLGKCRDKEGKTYIQISHFS